MATVAFEHLTKRFENSFLAVDDFSLAVNDGELLVLVGPSGCGKSTVLRILAGLEDPSDGEVRIDGNSVNLLAPRDRDIAMVFQSYALYPHLTVRENIEFGLKIHRIPEEEITQRVKVASDLLGLGEVLDRRPKQLSGGHCSIHQLGPIGQDRLLHRGHDWLHGVGQLRRDVHFKRLFAKRHNQFFKPKPIGHVADLQAFGAQG